MSSSSDLHPQRQEAFRRLAGSLMKDQALTPRGAVLLDFCGKALGLEGQERRDLVLSPCQEALPCERLLSLLEGLLPDGQPEIRQDLRNGLLEVLHGSLPDSPAPPLCPHCHTHRGRPTQMLWLCPSGAGLASLEGVRRSSWVCLECHAVFECVDDLSAGHHSRSQEFLIPSDESSRFLWEIRRNDLEPRELTRQLESSLYPAWILERLPQAIPIIQRTLGAERQRLAALPELAPKAYRTSLDLIRLGPPPTPAHWHALIEAKDLPLQLLTGLYRLPGAPAEVRRQFLEDPNPELQYVAYQAPDVPQEFLLAALESSSPERVLAVLDRSDVGRNTLSMALETQDPHVHYRALRHPCLDLFLLEASRRFRRGNRNGPLPPSRVLHVYAPVTDHESRELLLDVETVLREVLETQGWSFEGGNGVPLRLEIFRVTRSRLLIPLPHPEPANGQLLLEALIQALIAGLLKNLAREVLDLSVEEARGCWSARLSQPGTVPTDLSGAGLPPCDSDTPPLAWLELELLIAGRAIPYAGHGSGQTFPRLRTRPPYVSPDTAEDPPLVIEAWPPA